MPINSPNGAKFVLSTIINEKPEDISFLPFYNPLFYI
jgi:hypothetical protein